MIVLPDEDEKPVAAQVNAAIGDALRLSVAEAAFSPGFEARLAAALDAAGSLGTASVPGGGEAAPATLENGSQEQAGGAQAAAADAAGQGTQAAEVAS